MKPILKKAEGVLEEVLAYKPRKRKSVPQEDYGQGMPYAGEACVESF
jgi:Zn-dependent peptidase ImmA (M78 family)